MSAMPIPADLPGQVPPLDMDYAISRIAYEAAGAGMDAGVLAAEMALTAKPADADGYDEYGGAGRWYITDHQQAEWAMRKLAEAEGDLDRIREQAEAWIGQITEWAARERRSPEVTAAFMRAHLERYAVDRRDHDPSAKTLHLPSGVVRTTQRAERLVVADEDALVRWAQQSDAPVLRMTVKPAMDALKDATRVVDWYLGICWACSTCGMQNLVADGPDLPTVEQKWECNGCGSEGVVGQVETVASTRRVSYDDGAGAVPVPGTTVEPSRVTATVVVER